jgi:hypothetical protein
MMPEPNYYRPPATPDSPDVDLGRKIANLLLEARDKGYTLGRYYRWQARIYVFLLLIFGAGIAYFAWLGFEAAAVAMVGMLAGVLLRDFGVARGQMKSWPIQSRLLDWDRVRRLADGEALDD